MKSNRYTPIKCYKTNVPLYLGDKVKDCQGRFGYLSWDDVFNHYYIKPKEGGKIKTQQYIKVDKLEKNTLDTTRVECRRNHLKRKF